MNAKVIERKYFYRLEGSHMEHHAAILVNGVWYVEYTDETLDGYKASRPDQVFSPLYSWEAYEPIIRDHDKKQLIDPPAKEISRSRYWEMLEILPPCRWHHYQEIEFFHLYERITGDIVSWFAILKGRHYEFAHYANASDEELAVKILEVAK